MKIYHSENKPKTIIEHNLDENEKRDITKVLEFENVEHSVDIQNLVTNKKHNHEKLLTEKSLLKNGDVQNCSESKLQLGVKRNIHQKFITKDRIISKYRRIRQKISRRKELKEKNRKRLDPVNFDELKVKRCDVLIRKMKIKPLFLRKCQTNQMRAENGISCGSCGQTFAVRKHLELHKEFCHEVYMIRFKCKFHMLETGELCSSLSFKIY